MKKSLFILCIIGASSAMCQTLVNDKVDNTLPKLSSGLNVSRQALGSGTPAPMVTIGNELAKYIDDGYYHLPQDMPYYPTAAVIWPRVVELECEKVKGNVICEGYHWQPKMGRGEYLFIVPRLKAAPVVLPPVVIYKEVPFKKKAE